MPRNSSEKLTTNVDNVLWTLDIAAPAPAPHRLLRCRLRRRLRRRLLSHQGEEQEDNEDNPNVCCLCS